MNSTKQFYENIDEYRAIPIHQILGIPNTGRRITIKCPVHSEKSGSFSLYKDGSYYCFGCHANGSNAIDLCKDLGFSFRESLEELKPYLTS